MELWELSDPRIDWQNMATMKNLTCVNHQLTRYLTKNPWSRSLHVIKGQHGRVIDFDSECGCPFSDLRLVTTPLGTVSWGRDNR